MSELADNANASLPQGGNLLSAKLVEPRFTSTFEPKLDTQKRAQFPVPWRPADPGTTFMLVLWPHDKVKPEKEFGFIKGLTMRQFDVMMDKLEAKRAGGKDVGAARRKIYGNASEITVDPAGRLCLPPKFAAKIGLGTEARFVGAGSHFEIWDPAIFKTCTEAESDLADEGYDDLI